MLSKREIDLLAEFYDTPMLSDACKDQVRRAFSEADSDRACAAVIAEVARTLQYLLERGMTEESVRLPRAA